MSKENTPKQWPSKEMEDWEAGWEAAKLDTKIHVDYILKKLYQDRDHSLLHGGTKCIDAKIQLLENLTI